MEQKTESPVRKKTCLVDRADPKAPKLVLETEFTSGHKCREVFGNYFGVIILPNHWKSQIKAQLLLDQTQKGQKARLEMMDASGKTIVEGAEANGIAGKLAFHIFARESQPALDFSQFKSEPEFLPVKTNP